MPAMSDTDSKLENVVHSESVPDQRAILSRKFHKLVYPRSTRPSATASSASSSSPAAFHVAGTPGWAVVVQVLMTTLAKGLALGRVQGRPVGPALPSEVTAYVRLLRWAETGLALLAPVGVDAKYTAVEMERVVVGCIYAIIGNCVLIYHIHDHSEILTILSVCVCIVVVAQIGLVIGALTCTTLHPDPRPKPSKWNDICVEIALRFAQGTEGLFRLAIRGCQYCVSPAAGAIVRAVAHKSSGESKTPQLFRQPVTMTKTRSRQQSYQAVFPRLLLALPSRAFNVLLPFLTCTELVALRTVNTQLSFLLHFRGLRALESLVKSYYLTAAASKRSAVRKQYQRVNFMLSDSDDDEDYNPVVVSSHIQLRKLDWLTRRTRLTKMLQQYRAAVHAAHAVVSKRRLTRTKYDLGQRRQAKLPVTALVFEPDFLRAGTALCVAHACALLPMKIASTIWAEAYDWTTVSTLTQTFAVLWAMVELIYIVNRHTQRATINMFIAAYLCVIAVLLWFHPDHSDALWASFQYWVWGHKLWLVGTLVHCVTGLTVIITIEHTVALVYNKTLFEFRRRWPPQKESIAFRWSLLQTVGSVVASLLIEYYLEVDAWWLFGWVFPVLMPWIFLYDLCQDLKQYGIAMGIYALIMYPLYFFSGREEIQPFYGYVQLAVFLALAQTPYSVYAPLSRYAKRNKYVTLGGCGVVFLAIDLLFRLSTALLGGSALSRFCFPHWPLLGYAVYVTTYYGKLTTGIGVRKLWKEPKRVLLAVALTVLLDAVALITPSSVYSPEYTLHALPWLSVFNVVRVGQVVLSSALLMTPVVVPVLWLWAWMFEDVCGISVFDTCGPVAAAKWLLPVKALYDRSRVFGRWRTLTLYAGSMLAGGYVLLYTLGQDVLPAIDSVEQIPLAPPPHGFYQLFVAQYFWNCQFLFRVLKDLRFLTLIFIGLYPLPLAHFLSDFTLWGDDCLSVLQLVPYYAPAQAQMNLNVVLELPAERARLLSLDYGLLSRRFVLAGQWVLMLMVVQLFPEYLHPDEHIGDGGEGITAHYLLYAVLLVYLFAFVVGFLAYCSVADYLSGRMTATQVVLMLQVFLWCCFYANVVVPLNDVHHYRPCGDLATLPSLQAARIFTDAWTQVLLMLSHFLVVFMIQQESLRVMTGQVGA